MIPFYQNALDFNNNYLSHFSALVRVNMILKKSLTDTTIGYRRTTAIHVCVCVRVCRWILMKTLRMVIF